MIFDIDFQIFANTYKGDAKMTICHVLIVNNIIIIIMQMNKLMIYADS